MTEATTAIEVQAQTKLLDVLRKYEGPIKALIGRTLDPVRFSQLAVSAIKSNPALAGCSPSSFMNSVLLAMQMGVEIRRDSAYLIPFGRQCQLLLDYKAKISLARRGGKVGGIQAVSIRERDEFRQWYDEKGFHIIHRPSPEGQVRSAEERGNLIGVYAFAELIGGGMQWREPMSLDEIERIRKRSRAGCASVTLEEIREAGKLMPDGTQQVWQTWGFNDKRRTPWVTDWEQMAWKTALHSLYKGIPLDDATRMSQDADEGFETGHQRDFMGDFHSFDPVDAQPMVETTDAEGVKAIATQKIEQGQQEAARRKREPRATKTVHTGGAHPRALDRQQATGPLATPNREEAGQVGETAIEDEPMLFAPQTPTVADYRELIGDQAFWRILGSNGFESPNDIPENRRPAILRELANELELQRDEQRGATA